MSMAIAHFGLGAALTALVVLYLLPSVRYERAIVLFGGVWGMAPDAHWVSPVFRTELRAAHDSALVDVFWLHRTLDVLDRGDSPLVGAVMLGLFIGVSIVADQWDYTQYDRVPDTGASLQAPFRSLGLLSRLASLCGIAAGTLFVAYAFRLRTGRGLFVGIGAALLLTGVHGLTSDGTVGFRPERRWLRLAVRGGYVVLTVGGAVGGLTLLVEPLRAGLSLFSASHAGLGALVLLQTTLLARTYISGRTSNKK